MHNLSVSGPSPHLAFSSFCMLSVVLAVGGCSAPYVESVCAIPPAASPQETLAAVCACQSGVSQGSYGSYRRPKLDLLLVIGNTQGMANKQQALAQTFPTLLAILEQRDFDYHIGVISTDIGSWISANIPWTMSSGACDSFAGDDGQLQATSCLDRRKGSALAATACAAVCPDRKFMPTDGNPFLVRKNGKSNVPVALAPDAMTGLMVDRGPAYALQCLAMLGDGGCAISAPLESARRALDGHLSANNGFLRPDSVLYVVFLTDEDDCSVQLSRRGDNDPHTQNCATPDSSAAASCYSLGAYRCLARDVVCDQPMNVVGPKAGCQERADSYLTSVDSYVGFFYALRSPLALRIAGIWTIPSLTQGGRLVAAQNPNVAGSAGIGFATGNAASCMSPTDSTYIGQAQLRLSQFFAALNPPQADILAVPPMAINVCDRSSYLAAFDPLGVSLLIRYGPSCLPGLPALRPDGSPVCVVGDVPQDSPAATPELPMPTCSFSCCATFASNPGPPQLEPAIAAACVDEPSDCFCAVPSAPGICDYTGAVLGIWRKDNADPPPGTIVSSRCSLQCPSTQLR